MIEVKMMMSEWIDLFFAMWSVLWIIAIRIAVGLIAVAFTYWIITGEHLFG